MKKYEIMNPNENLSWCKPYMSDDGTKGFISCEGEAQDSWGGINIANEAELWENEELHEGGCPECPYRDECEAMDITDDEI